MSANHTLVTVFSAAAAAGRKARRSRRFDRIRAARPLVRLMREYWATGVDALFAHLTRIGGWDAIHRHAQLGTISKELTGADRELIMRLLINFSYFGDLQSRAAAIIEATSLPTFEAAARFALRKLGVYAADFSLRNERIKERLLERAGAVIFSTRNQIEQVFETIVRNFYELGRNPYNQEFIDELRAKLNYQTAWEARRFALTETGIAAELAQAETYRRNGVTRKQWNILGRNTRPTHAALDKVQVGIDEKFDVGGYAADHPLDPSLPAKELVNCHCWISPVVDDDFELDPGRIWEGE